MKTIRQIEEETRRLVGRRLREARRLHGLSIQQLGKALGVSHQAIEKYEKGELNITPGKLKALGELLEVPVGYFFNETDPDSYTGEPARRTLKVVRALRQIEDRDPQTFAVLAQFVSAFAKIR